MRHRTSVLAGTVLANYSEFGLIVVVVGASAGFVSEDWLAVLGSAVAMSFILSVVVNRRTGWLVAFAERRLPAQDAVQLHPDDRPIDVGHADAVVFGMGRVGQAAYHQLADTYGLRVVGIESREERAVQLREQGLDVIEGDATDPDLWHRLTQAGAVDIAVLAMPFHGSNLAAMKQLEASEFAGTIAAIAQYDDEAAELSGHVHSVFGLYDGAGTALADGVAERAGRRRDGEGPGASADA